MDETIVKKQRTSSQKLIKWGSILLFTPLVGLIAIFIWWTLVSLMDNILWWNSMGASVEQDPISTIVAFIRSILTLGWLLCTIWGLSLSPVGFVLLIIWFIKKKKPVETK